jgi:hypothetical protein
MIFNPQYQLFPLFDNTIINEWIPIYSLYRATSPVRIISTYKQQTLKFSGYHFFLCRHRSYYGNDQNRTCYYNLKKPK